jgi:myo-inositol-1(or 4)-monophosphatase
MGERLFLTGFQYQQEVRRLQGAAVARLVPQVRDVRRMGSAALELCSIASGEADAYVEEGLQVWDRAAAGLVATEAGARVQVLPGAGGMDCVVCAPADGYDEVLALVRSCGFLAPGVAG